MSRDIINLVDNLITCWPNTIEDIASSAELSIRQVSAFRSGKGMLEATQVGRLISVLGIHYDDELDKVTPGPCVMIARDARAVRCLYEDISRGGDSSPLEIVPKTGEADPSWRYIVFNAFGEMPSVFMLPRGSRSIDNFEDLLLNYAGICEADEEQYRDVVSTCAAAASSVKANSANMRNYADRNTDLWAGRMITFDPLRKWRRTRSTPLE